MRSHLRPARSASRSFHCIADVFAVAERRFAEQLALPPVNREGVAGVWPGLLSANVLLDSAVDSRVSRRNVILIVRRSVQFVRAIRFSFGSRQRMQPLRRQVLQHALASAFAAVSGFAIAAESACCVELVGTIHPHHARLHLRSQVQRDVDVLAPDARRQPVHSVVGQLCGLRRRAEGHRHQHRAKDLLLHHRRCRMHIGQQRRRIVATFLRQLIARLPAPRTLGHSRVYHFANGFQLDRRNNRANVNRLVQRRPNAQSFHACTQPRIERFSHAFLHQQSRSRAAYLPLVEPDGVNQPLHSGVQIGVIENNEGRFAAQFE